MWEKSERIVLIAVRLLKGIPVKFQELFTVLESLEVSTTKNILRLFFIAIIAEKRNELEKLTLIMKEEIFVVENAKMNGKKKV